MVNTDLLDEFPTTRIDASKNAPAPSTSKPTESINDQVASDTAADQFNHQLQEQMTALLSNMDETPEMKKEIEAMMRELGAAADSGVTTSKEVELDGLSASPVASAGGEEKFQETIRKTMKRMQISGEQATAAATSDDTDDIMDQMLKEMQAGGAAGAGVEDDFSNMLLNVMEQLTNKEILYEPMKELHGKFPAWMSNNTQSTKTDDLRRYEEQQRLVGEIVERFEEKGYSDSKAVDREYIVERMQKVR